MRPRPAIGAPSPASALEFEVAPTTVLTMAPNGAWGAATDHSVGPAIAATIARCNGRHQRSIGCGAAFTTIRGGWSLGLRCGKANILVAEKTLIEAEQAAIDRELVLRPQYPSGMAACVRVVSVGPSGAIVAPYAAELVRTVMHRQEDCGR